MCTSFFLFFIFYNCFSSPSGVNPGGWSTPLREETLKNNSHNVTVIIECASTHMRMSVSTKALAHSSTSPAPDDEQRALKGCGVWDARLNFSPACLPDEQSTSIPIPISPTNLASHNHL